MMINFNTRHLQPTQMGSTLLITSPSFAITTFFRKHKKKYIEEFVSGSLESKSNKRRFRKYKVLSNTPEKQALADAEEQSKKGK